MANGDTHPKPQYRRKSMGLLAKVFGSNITQKERQKNRNLRICRIEELEPRTLLAANPLYVPPDPIDFGIVFHDDTCLVNAIQEDSGEKISGDTFTISWNGGENGTKLTQLVIDLSTANPNHNLFLEKGSFSCSLAGVEGFISQNKKELTLTFGDNFTAGTLNFTVSVYRLESSGKISPVTDGLMFEGASLEATFKSENYKDCTIRGDFADEYPDPGTLGLTDLPKHNECHHEEGNGATSAGVIKSGRQEALTGTISGFVYHDRNNDGKRDAGEERINDVELSLWIWDDITEKYIRTDHGSVYTNENGKYTFENVEAFRKYQIREVQPDNYISGKNSVGTMNGQETGSLSEQYQDAIDGIWMAAQGIGENYNFGEYKNGSVSGFVYEDANGNETFDKNEGEKGIAGATLSLWVWNENVKEYVWFAQSVTDAAGYYEFNELRPGTKYQIQIGHLASDSGWSVSLGTLNGVVLPNAASEIALFSDDHGRNYNFGTYLYGSISGYVYEDANGNETFDEGDEGIKNVSVSLWVWGWDAALREYRYINTGKTTETNGDGFYKFESLEPFRKYQVRIEGQAYDSGWTSSAGTLDGVAAGNTIREIEMLLPDQHGEGYNFGTYLYGSISGYVYEDDNGNETFDKGEEGIKNVSVSLWVLGWDAALQEYLYINTGKTAVTNDDGFYKFESLEPFKKYQVRIEGQAYNSGWVSSAGTLDGIAAGNTIREIELLLPDQHGEDYNFGTYRYGLISGRVEDDGGNPIPGSVVELYDDEGNLIDSTTTDEDGYYEFTDLPPGTYGVKEYRPEEYCGGDGSPGSLGGEYLDGDNSIRDITITSGDEGTDYDFIANRRGIISGFVYVDEDRSGGRDDGERGLNGVTLTLWVWDGTSYVQTPKTALTGENGYYEFTGLCVGKKFKIMVEDCPEGYEEYEGDWLVAAGTIDGEPVGKPSDRDSNAISWIVLPPNGRGENYNFGKQEIEVEPPPVEPPVEPPPVEPPPVKPPVDPPPVHPPSTPVKPPYFVPPAPAGAGGFLGAPGVPAWYPSSFANSLQAGFGAGGGVLGQSAPYSWHLSVINAGYPRTNGSTDGITTGEVASKTTMILSGAEETPANGARYVSVAWTPMPMKQSGLYVRGKDGIVRKRFTFGPDGAIPVVGDFNGDGITNLAVYHEGSWYIDINGNGKWDEEDLWVQMGGAADQPVVGDWDGDGKADIGVFGPAWSGDSQILAVESGLPSDLNTTVASAPKNVPPDVSINASMDNVRAMKHSQSGGVRLDVVDHVFQYGSAGDKAFTGDFTGDGISTIGVYRDGKWYIDRTGSGKWDENAVLVDNAEFGLGAEGIPVIGDFSGDGIDKIGLYVEGVWYLDTTGDFKFDTQVEFGEAGDYPVVGDFDGTGIAQLAVYRASTSAAESLYANAPEASPATGREMVAQRYGAGQELESDQGSDQGVLQKHGRSLHTPHTNAPLLRGR